MWRLMVLGFLLTVFVGCGTGDTPPTSHGGSATGGASTGGSSAGGASTGGTSSGGVSTGGLIGSGGRPATGGNAGTGGAGGRSGIGGATSTGGAPMSPVGPVDTCRGDACPLGPCDNGRFFSDKKCSDVYKGPVDKDSRFCATGVEGGYCLNTITNVITYWAITCSGNEPTFSLCRGGCLLSANVAQCN